MSGTTPTPKINELFYRNIDREINEVVKVDNDDPKLVKQELDEYILTPQLEAYFSEVFEAVRDTEHGQTEDVGVWISGFFGSGKSHFMKILGYLLENRQLPDGNTAAEIFKQRTDDEMLKGAVDSVDQKFESEVLMFQIGAKADATGAESITEIVHREFNIQRGYAAIPWVADLESDLEAEGRYAAFKEAIEEQKGEPWETVRSRATFLRNDVKKALAACTPDYDEDDAAQAIEDVEDAVLVNATTLASDIKEHVDRQESKTGAELRYFVFIDEISQFIGDDKEKILTLQSIVEEFGQRGQGDLWLGVTSQEELKELVEGVLVNQEEQNKVRDRFPNRFNLRSEDLDKIVRERILQKDPSHHAALQELYAEHEGMLSARYKLDAGRGLKEINEENFIDCYPFLPYQLDVLPAIFGALRGKGSDDRLTGRERTLIDVTQSVLKDSELLYGQELGQLVTLDLIFDEIKEEISDADVSSIESASPKDADATLARRVLKSLYLLQQLDWIPNTPENIATTLQREIGQTHELESAVEEALDGLVDAGYVGRSEDGYRFLRETERELENDIKAVDIKIADVRRFSKSVLMDEILDGTTSVRYENQAFDVAVEVDGEALSTAGHLALQTYSPIYQAYEDVEPKTLKQRSFSTEDTIYWIATQADADELESDIERILQVEEIVRVKRGQKLSEEEREALTQKEEDVTRLRRTVERRLTKAYQNGTLIYNGNQTELDETNKDLDSIIRAPAKDAIPRVFTKLEHGLATVKDRHLEQIFGDLESSSMPSVFDELDVILDGDLNPEARIASEVESEIQRRETAGEDRRGDDLATHFAAPPYGWSRDVVRLAAAVLFRNGSVVATYQERSFESYTDDGAQELFTQVSKFRKTSFDERETVDPTTRNDAKQLLDRLFDKKVKRTDQAVAAGIGEAVQIWTSRVEGMKRELERAEFPLLAQVEEFATRLQNLEQQPTAAKRISTFVDFESELEELTPIVADVYAFASDGNLATYHTYVEFLTDEWATLVEKADSTGSLVTVTPEERAAAERLEGILSSEQVISSWTDARTEYQTIARAYANTYENLYETRYETYQEAIERVRPTDADLDESDIETALRPLSSKLGEPSLSIDVSAGEHLNRAPSLTRLIEHIQTVDSYENQARENVDELVIDDNGLTRTKVDVMAIFTGVSISEPSELDAYLDELRGEVETAFEEGDADEVRF